MNGRSFLSLRRCSSRSRCRNGPSFGRRNYRSSYSRFRRRNDPSNPRFGGSSGSGHRFGNRNSWKNSLTICRRGVSIRTNFLRRG